MITLRLMNVRPPDLEYDFSTIVDDSSILKFLRNNSKQLPKEKLDEGQFMTSL